MSGEELNALSEIARRRKLTVIFDEVFSEFIEGETLPRPRAEDFPLVISLNGFSKMFSLPGWKFGWMKVDGESEYVQPFLRALEQMADTFLPVNELVQATAPGLLAAGDPMVSQRLASAFAERRNVALEQMPLECPNPKAGIYLCPRLPEGTGDMDLALAALRNHGVLLHPGFYYGLPRHLVMTCVASSEVLTQGLSRLREALNP